MNKIKNLVVGLTIVSLLAVGVVAVAGNGFGASESWAPQQAATGDCDLNEHDFDGDGILNSEDSDWVRPMDGSGYGVSQGNAQGLSGDRPVDGSGYGAGLGQGSGSGTRDGSCF
ncbi:hypothetical protein KAR02_03260 [Candidatus Bipolaricaulota bacterium]|nr:hypothetical protein [Candidatus Bipolaricaulota bacterium]